MKDQIKNIKEEYNKHKQDVSKKEDELKELFYKLISEFEGKFNNYEQEYNKIKQELQNELKKNQILNKNAVAINDQLQEAKTTIEKLSNKLKNYDSLKSASSKLLDRIKLFEKHTEDEDDLITNDGSTYGDDDSMDFETNEITSDSRDFFILDEKNKIFKLSDIRSKKNPLSACPLYNCNGKNNRSFHKCSRTCPKIQKFDLVKCDYEPEVEIFKSIKDIPRDFSIYRPQETLVF